ncbi:MAG: TonB-dependent receptor [Gammaproteobacteria bacterium]|nr:TonB-dependent receptor [Gammaproteobacteria bacterium]
MTVSQHRAFALLPLLILCCAVARAESRCAETVATVVSVQGNVDVRGKDAQAWQPVTADLEICAGDSVTVRRFSRAVLRLEREQTNVQLGEGSTLTLPGGKEQEFSVVELLKGITHFISRVPHALKIKTPFVNAAVEGTEFIVKVDDEQALVSVTEGHVNAGNAAGKLLLQSGQSALTTRGAAPGAYTVADPMESVQWALYYPHVFEFEPKDITNFGLEPWRAIVADSVRALRANNLSAALTLLEQAGDGITSTQYLLYRAHLLLMVGRVAEAQADIENVLTVESGSSVAWVMRSVIAVTQGRAQFALEAAQKAVQADANSAPALLALSYAYQAKFDLDNALAAALTATKKNESSALVWARVAELQLMHGRLEQALLSAQRAEEINPNSAQAKTVLGFAALVELQTGSAAIAFDSAAHLDPAAPLPRLGLGLVKIRQGDLDGGRAQLEIATSLDPRASSLRSYVGKAYYEEHRDTLAAQQFNYAKELDPNDPTPWFYNAFLLQVQNRPGAALVELQKSMELNDNRGVYRSRLLLDDDLAVRGVSIARTYQKLGFDQSAIAEGTRALALSPGNASAHQFLADAYTNRPRHETARVSELLQAQLLQPLNVEPPRPRLGEVNLLPFEGGSLAAPGLNEYAPLFERPRISADIDVLNGPHNTDGHEVTASVVSSNGVFSIGQFNYSSDGVRINNDSDQTVKTVFGQYRVNSQLSVQAEYRDKESEFGDRLIRFYLDDAITDQRQRITEPSWMLGLRYEPAPEQLLVAAVSRSILKDVAEIGELTSFSSKSIKGQIEAQYLGKLNNARYLVGYARLITHRRSIYSVDDSLVEIPGYTPVGLVITETEKDVDQKNLYGYWHYHLGGAALILGGSFDSVNEQNGVNVDGWNPKLGLLWELSPNTMLRAAAFRTTNRNLVRNQTLEPTQVAGFNQFFDDSLGTRARRYGLGIDNKWSTNIATGAEISRRKLDFVIANGIDNIEKRSERAHRAYANLLLRSDVALHAELTHESSSRDYILGQPGNLPAEMITQRLPLELRYFHASGFYTRVRATQVNQKVINALFPEGTETLRDRFWIGDMALGWSFPKGRGLVEVKMLNVFDRTFHYQSVDAGSGEATPDPFYPERAIFFDARLSF